MDENLVLTMNENMVFDNEWEYGVWLWMRICWTVDYGWEYGVDNEW